MKLDIVLKDKKKLVFNIIFVINIALFILSICCPEIIFGILDKIPAGPSFLLTLFLAVVNPLLLGIEIISLLKNKNIGLVSLALIIYPALPFLVLMSWEDPKFLGFFALFLLVPTMPLCFILGLISIIVTYKKTKLNHN